MRRTVESVPLGRNYVAHSIAARSGPDGVVENLHQNGISTSRPPTIFARHTRTEGFSWTMYC